MLSSKDKPTVKFCQCTFSDYLKLFANSSDEEYEDDDNKELSSLISTIPNIKEEEK